MRLSAQLTCLPYMLTDARLVTVTVQQLMRQCSQYQGDGYQTSITNLPKSSEQPQQVLLLLQCFWTHLAGCMRAGTAAAAGGPRRLYACLVRAAMLGKSNTTVAGRSTPKALHSLQSPFSFPGGQLWATCSHEEGNSSWSSAGCPSQQAACQRAFFPL